MVKPTEMIQLALYFVLCLLTMLFPFAFGDLHLSKRRFEGGLARAAGIYAENHLVRSFPKMANPHLVELGAVCAALDAVVRLPTAQAVPHRLYRRIDIRGGPIGITQVGDHAPQALEPLVLVLDGCFLA